jgi:hypothetical protein
MKKQKNKIMEAWQHGFREGVHIAAEIADDYSTDDCSIGDRILKNLGMLKKKPSKNTKKHICND